MEILGIDIGGSGIKGAVVDVTTGQFTQERYRVDTPQPSSPDAIANAVANVIEYFQWRSLVGCTFPAVVKQGVMQTAANVDPSWIGTNGQQLFEEQTNCPFIVLNDADAAGIAEMTFGSGKGRQGLVMILTFGTGIGSAMFQDGHLIANTELGHLELRGKPAEHRASNRIREEKELSWAKWTKRVNEYLQYLEFLFSPDLFIIGGGVSRKYDKFFPLLEVRTELIPATFFNDAGIVGAALAAHATAK
ncbi:MAG: ROK family protein [Anaerolineae bacterium]|jgi:polyphosphate glucokinase|nr:ROK family protein [Anaerolineae bacterium]